MVRELEWYEVGQKQKITLKDIPKMALLRYSKIWNWSYNQYLKNKDKELFKFRIQNSLIKLNEMINSNINDKYKTTNLKTYDKINVINCIKNKKGKFEEHHAKYQSLISETNFCCLSMIENVFNSCLDKQNMNNKNFATYFYGAIKNFIGNISNKIKGKKYQYVSTQKIIYFDKEEEKKIIEQYSKNYFSDDIDFKIYLEQFSNTLCDDEKEVFETLREEEFVTDKDRSKYLGISERTFRRKKQNIKQRWLIFNQSGEKHLIS